MARRCDGVRRFDAPGQPAVQAPYERGMSPVYSNGLDTRLGILRVMKIGIVGCGMISGHHLTAATRYPRAAVIGLVDRDLVRARAQAERFSVKNVFDDLAGLLALKPDVVHVLTPPASHRAVVLEALAGGANVYVEKPMALSVADCEAMTRAAVAADRQLCVGHNWLYSPTVLQAQA